MPDAPQVAAPPQSPAQPPPPPPPKVYTLGFEPIGEFSETELFLKGVIRAKLWISEKVPAHFRSLTGEDVDKVNEAVKVTPQMTASQYNTEITYHNLAHSIEAIGGAPFTGTVDERLKKIRAMASAVLGRLTMAYLEFNDHVDELFVGKGVGDLAKKS